MHSLNSCFHEVLFPFVLESALTSVIYKENNYYKMVKNFDSSTVIFGEVEVLVAQR